MVIFHLVRRADWEAALAQGEYKPPSLQREGFIHFSTAEQLLRSAERHFPERCDLLVISVRTELLRAPLRFEPAHGEEFPHLYGPLNLDAVIETVPLPLDGSGRFTLR